jgi:2-keto-4-pentenoate hydratase
MTTSPVLDDAVLDDAALDDAVERLRRAAADGVPCAPVRDLIGSGDIAAAYRVQSALIAERIGRGAVRVGRKIGLTSPAVQQQLGVEQPDFGVLLDDMAVPDGGTVPPGRLLQPKVEGEVAFRLGADLDGTLDRATVRGAVASAHAAVEIVDSRVAGWDIRIADTVADNASSGLYVVSDRAVPLDEVEPVAVTMTLEVNGQVVSRGSGSDCLGDPLTALEWLARTAAEFGDPLRAGELVLSGALGPMVVVQPGDRVQVEISGLGAVHASFGTGER